MNNSVKKCCICNNKKIGEFITINDNKYHLCCIEQLKEQRQELRSWLEGLIEECKLEDIIQLSIFHFVLSKLNELEGGKNG